MLDPKYFKNEWLKIDNNPRWYQFDHLEVEKSPLLNSTKDFLRVGFPEGSPPFLDFGWRSYDGKFYNIKDYYQDDFDMDNEKANYWIFGSDNSGDMICFDVSKNDQIILLDHEQEFEVRTTMNKNIYELAECLLVYKNFVNTIIKENGSSSFSKADFNDSQFETMCNSFRKIDKDILEIRNYWGSEIKHLLGNREFYKKK